MLFRSEHRGNAGSDPWSSRNGWRMNLRLQRKLMFASAGNTLHLTLTYVLDGWQLGFDGSVSQVTPVQHAGNDHIVRIDGQIVSGTVIFDSDSVHVFCANQQTILQYTDPLAHAGHAEAEAGRLTAPMSGKIVAILVKLGDMVTRGTPLLILEAMKMEHTIAAPHDGVVTDLLYAVGDQVEEDVPLLAFKNPVDATTLA